MISGLRAWATRAAGYTLRDLRAVKLRAYGRHLIRVAALLALTRAASGVCDGRPFGLADYFQVERVTELALSPDGKRLAYATDRSSLEANRTIRRVCVRMELDEEHTECIDVLTNSQQLTWFSNARELVYLSTKTGVNQLFAYDLATTAIRQLSPPSHRVVAFRVHPTGGAIAYITSSRSESIYQQMRRKGPGILVDTENIGYMDLFDATREDTKQRDKRQLWITSSKDVSARLAPIPGDVRDVHWSSDGRLLSVVYVSEHEPPSMFRPYRTSIGVLDLGRMAFSVLAQSDRPSALMPGKAYFGGEWLPGESRIAIRRVTETRPWLRDWHFPEFAIVDPLSTWREEGVAWTRVELPLFATRIIPGTGSHVYAETTVRAKQSLQMIGRSGLSPSPITEGLAGSNSLFQFSVDFRTAVFLNESLSRPPEIFVWDESASTPRRISALNSQLSQLRLPGVEEIVWQSSDGTRVSGWLLSPDVQQYPKPWPLITYVHGGPASPFPDAFAPLAVAWPYPLEVYALNGMAVFIPNYRGTRSYGTRIASPSKIDLEPIDDVMCGVDYLVRAGIADPAKLGINGHSHGAWLGPLIAARTNKFRAGSFAEGWSNQLILHELNSVELNREVHEAGFGEESLYDRPDRYLALSPDLHFKNLTAAMLFEAGSEAVAMQMLGMAKAARRFGIPSEFVIYPLTGHTLTTPRLQAESAERNLDWFLYWLVGREDTAPTKLTQYDRWRSLRDSALTLEKRRLTGEQNARARHHTHPVVFLTTPARSAGCPRSVQPTS